MGCWTPLPPTRSVRVWCCRRRGHCVSSRCARATQLIRHPHRSERTVHRWPAERIFLKQGAVAAHGDRQRKAGRAWGKDPVLAAQRSSVQGEKDGMCGVKRGAFLSRRVGRRSTVFFTELISPGLGGPRFTSSDEKAAARRASLTILVANEQILKLTVLRPVPETRVRLHWRPSAGGRPASRLRSRRPRVRVCCGDSAATAEPCPAWGQRFRRRRQAAPSALWSPLWSSAQRPTRVRLRPAQGLPSWRR